MASFLWVTYPSKKKDGEWSHSLGDLPRKDDGLIVMGDLPKMEKNVKCGLIVMGDLPRWKKYDEVRSHCHG